jgi:curved DNA-binding protein CbpA
MTPSPTRTAYEVLGVAPTASGAQIRAAYLELIARYHPDRHAGHPLAGLAADRAAELNEAYRILSDPGRRAVHDEDIRLAATKASARSRVARETAALVILLRVLAIGVALVIVLRLSPIFWRAIAGLFRSIQQGLAGAAGTPLTLLFPLAALTGIVVWGLRARRRRSGKRPGRAGGTRFD